MIWFLPLFPFVLLISVGVITMILISQTAKMIIEDELKTMMETAKSIVGRFRNHK